MQKVLFNYWLKLLSVLIGITILIPSASVLGGIPGPGLPSIHGTTVVGSIEAQEEEPEIIVYFPFVKQPARVDLTSVWTAESTGASMEAFLPGKIIRFYGKGYVNIRDGASVNLRWSMIGPCGSKTLANETVLINPGLWTFYRTDIAPNCPGIYVYTLRLDYQGEVTFLSVPYVINNPSEISTISRQGFDKCNIPYGSKTESVNQMQTWWYLSPYYITNLYIGGVSRYCSNTELDAVWVNLVARQGWSFIPTWVGPQAPCTSFRYKFSYDLNTAYSQGIIEANSAVSAARNLGFLGNAVIYYDMEMYSTTNTACQLAVQSFLRGWTQRVKEYGLRSGVYGHRVNANDWASISPAPDSAWIAYWVYPFAYNPYASAYGIPGVADSLWYRHRIRQYAGDHVETYGGFAFGIDSNIADGDVTVLGNSVLSEYDGSTSLDDTPTTELEPAAISSPLVQDIQLITDVTGWGMLNHRVFWTKDGGESWEEVLPAQAVPGSMMAAHYLDTTRGWLVSQHPLTGEVLLHKTEDGGETWVDSVLLPANLDYGPITSAVYIEILDEKTGWVIVKQASSSNFSLGILFRTDDGGETWQKLSAPLGEPVHFVDPTRGWMAGGPSGDELFATQDGGLSWEKENIYDRIPLPVEHVFVGLPVFTDNRNGILPLKVISDGSNTLNLLVTSDGGMTWEECATNFLENTHSPGEGLLVSKDGSSNLYLVIGEIAQNIDLSHSIGDITRGETTTIPEGAVKVELGSHGFGWAMVRTGDCQNEKLNPVGMPGRVGGGTQCEIHSQILKTQDGGITWQEITPEVP